MMDPHVLPHAPSPSTQPSVLVCANLIDLKGQYTKETNS